jgi:hypothetical protein
LAAFPLASFRRPSHDPAIPFSPWSLTMIDETEPERRTIHVFDIDLETGEVPVRELYVVHEAETKPLRTNILSLDLSRAVEKLDEAENTADPFGSSE